MKIRRLQRWISEQLFGHSLKLAAGSVLAFNVGLTVANAQTWAPTTSANWNDTLSWSGGVIPVSGTTTALTFGGTTAYTATNDIGPFTLNSITVSNTNATTIDGGVGLTFAGTTPAITINAGSGASTILGPMTYSAATAITNNSGSLLTLGGAQTLNANPTFSGSGAKTISGNVSYTANRTITNNGGLLTLSAAHTPGANLTIAGTGATSITGQTILTAARTITNSATGSVTLGDVDLGGFALTTAGTGSTTISGNITESAAGGSLTSRSNGATTGATLTLSGTLGYTGSTNINAGSKFAYTNAAANASMGTLNFGSGLGYLATSAGQGALTFSSITSGPGAFGIVANTSASKILIGGTPVTNDLIAGNIYYGGSNTDGRSFAVIDATTKEIRAMNYATDNGAVISSGTAIPAGNAGQNIDLTNTAGLTSQQSISIKSLLADSSVASALTLETGATLTISSGGLAASNNSTGTFTITGGTALTTGSSTSLYVRTQTTNGNFVINTPITGTGGLSVSGQSTTGLTLGAANTFSGDTRIVNSVTTGLSLNHVLALQNSTLDLNADDSGTVAFTAASIAGAPYILGGLSGSRALGLGTAFVTIGNNNQNTTYSGVLSGTNGFTKIGTGALTLSGANTFTGNVALTGGTLVVGATATLGATGNTVNVSNGTTIRLNANLTTSTQTHIFSLAANATATLDTGTFTASILGNHLIGTTGTLNKIGTGTLQVGSSGTATVGTINVNAGILQVTSQRLGSVGAINVASGARFTINDDGNPATFSIAAGKTLTLNGTGITGTGAFTLVDQSPTAVTVGPFTNWTNAITLATDSSFGINNASGTGANVNRFSTLSLNGAVTGPGNLIKTGNGNLILSAAGNTYGGATSTTTVLNGGLQISGGNDRLPVATAMILGDVTANTSGIFDVNGLSQTITGLTTAGTGTANRVISTNTTTTGTLNVNLATGSQTYAGFLGGTVTLGGTPVPGDNLKFVKSGAGNLTLTAENTYSGSTTVSAGTLTIASAAALPSSSAPVTVASGAVLDLSALAGGYSFGAGRVLTAGRTTAAANDIVGSANVAGTFNVGGTNTAATATISGNTTFNGATLQFDLNNIVTSGNDLVAVGGNLTFTGTNTIAITKPNGLGNGNYTLFTYAGTLTGNSSNFTLNGAGGARQTATIVDTALTPGSVQLAITGNTANLTWAGNISNVWDQATTANFTGAVDNRFYDSDIVTFNDSGVGGATPVLVTGVLNPTSLTVAGTKNYTFSDGGSGSISGTGNIALNSTGTTTLGVPVTTVGTTTLTAGTLTVATGGSITGPLTMSAGTVNATVDGAFTGSAAINGGTFIATNPTGNAINSSSISVSGTGVLQIGNGGTEGNINGLVTLATNGTLAFNRSDAPTLSNVITGSGNIANNGSGDISLSTALTSGSYNFTGTGKTILTGNLSGTTSITQSGTGTTKLAPSTLNNTQTGAINITGGTLEVGILGTTGNAAAVVTINGGTYHATVGQSNTQAFNIGANGGTIKVNPGFVFVKGTNGINGVGNTLTVTGGGTVALQGSGSSNISNVIVADGIYRHTSARYAAANTTPYTVTVQPGGTLFNLDTVSFTGTAYFPFGNTSGVPGSTITLSGDGYAGGGGIDNTTMFGAYLHALGEVATPATNLATSNINVPVILASTSRFTLAVGTDTPANRSSTDRIVDSLIGGVSGPGGLIVDGDGNGTLAISNVAATYGGPTRVANGTLRIGLNNALPTGTTLTLGGTTGDNVVDSSGTFELNGFSQTVTGLATLGNGTANRIGNAPAGDGALIVNYNGVSPQTFSGQIGYVDGNSISFRNLALTKNGTGTLILSGTNDYTSATTVNAGTLSIASAASLPSNTGAVTVASGAVLDVSALAGGYSFIAGRTVTLGRTTTPANDLVGSASIAGTLNIGGTNTMATATISGDLALNAASLNFDLSNSLLTGNDRLSIGGNLNATGVTTIVVNQTGSSLAQGSYTLFNYSGTLTGSASNFGLAGSISSAGTRATYTINTGTVGSVLLNVTGSPANLTWAGNSSNNVWDLTTPANFTGATGAIPDNRFFNSDSVTFNATGVGGTNPVTVTGALVPATVSVSGTQDYILSGTGNITTTSLTKDGAASLTLNVPVTSTTTTVNAGTLAVGTGGSISGPVALTGGTLNGNVTGAVNGVVTMTGGTANATADGAFNGSVTINGGTFIASNTAGSAINGGPVSVSGTGVLQIGNGGTNGIITSAIALASGSTLTFNRSDAITSDNALSINGNTTINNQGAGVVTRSADTSVGVNTLTLGGTGDLALGGIVSGSGQIVKNGSGTVTLLADNDAFTGTVTINEGTLALNDLGANGDLSASLITVNSAGKFVFGPTGNPDFPNSTFIAINGGEADFQIGEVYGATKITNNGTLRLTGDGAIGRDVTSAASAGPFVGFELESGSIISTNTGPGTGSLTGSATAPMTKSTSGTVAFTGPITYAATMPINLQNGVLDFQAANLPTNAGTGVFTLGDTATNGTLRLSGSTSASSARTFALANGGGTIEVSSAATKLTLSGAVTAVGTGQLTKTGPGTLALTGANTYTGGTTISAGTLQVGTGGTVGTGVVTNNATLDVARAGLTTAAITGTGTTTVSTAGATLTANSIRQATLNIGAGNTVTVAPNGGNSSVSVLNSLSVTGGAAPTGTLDLKDNDLIVKNTDLTAAAATHALINAQVKNASNGFAWDQPGITSSTVQTDLGAGTPTALGILLNNDGQGGSLFYGDGIGLPQFSGQTVNENAVLVKYTWLGDSDLNGVVNIDDFTYFQLGYGGGAPYTGWAFGDYDYNGVVNVDDFTYFQLGFGGQFGPALSAAPNALTGLGVSAVPEPGTWAVMIGLVGATALRARRWSKKKETLL